MGCGYHGGIKDRQPGVHVEGASVENGGKCFLVLDERFEVAHRYLKMVQELRALLEDEGLVAGR
jgi:hypothetical protein